MSFEKARVMSKYMKAQGIMSFPSRPQEQPSTCLYHIFCTNDLQATSLEHVFNSAWGGRVKVRWLICPQCNPDFSNTLDTSFTYLLSKIKNTRAMVTERNSEPPTLQSIEGVRFEPYAIPVVPNEAHEGELRYTEDIEFSPSLQYRSAAHTCLKALGYFQPVIVRNKIFDPVKAFIYKGEGSFHDFAVITDEIEELLPTKKQFFIRQTNHMMIYFSKRLDKVIGIFRLLGVVKRSIILSNEWRGEEGVLIVYEDYRATQPKIENRYREFVVDAGLPEFVTVDDKQIDESFFKEEILYIQKYAFALGPTYWFSDYLKQLEESDTHLTHEVLTEVVNRACAFIATLLERVENVSGNIQDVRSALAENGMSELIAEYEGNKIDIGFHKRLQEVMQNATLVIYPDMRFLE